MDERSIKHHRVCEYLDSHQLDAVLLTRRCNFSWYTCGAHNYVGMATDVGNSSLLVRRDGASVLANNIEATRLRDEELHASGIEIVEYPYYDAAARAKTFADAVGKSRIAADAPLAWVEAPNLGDDFSRLRWTLTEDELDRYEDLCLDVAAAIEYIARDVSPGVSEDELAGMLAGALRCTACVPWVLLVAADDRIDHFRHPLPTDKTVQKRFMLVTCAERDGLIAACTRIAHFGPLDEQLAARHRAVVAVDAALISATQPGASLGDIYSQMQAAYAQVGFADQWRLHHQGGSIGYLPREVIALPGEKTRVLADQPFAWNPSITGTKSEDTIVCTEDGPQVLTDTGDWPMIDVQWNGFTVRRPDILTR